MASEYDGIVKRLIRAYKFERVRAAYQALAAGMIDTLPYLGADILVVHIPTATTRVRQRGYDHARLLAREIARRQGWQHRSLLRRRHNDRQVGSSRAQRFRQAREAFVCSDDLRGKHILLVDDVTTSGATLAAAANVLAAAGAACVDAVVAAKHTLE